MTGVDAETEKDSEDRSIASDLKSMNMEEVTENLMS
jgi:hypothetical protein